MTPPANLSLILRMNTVALDIGGAHLKGADSAGRARSRSFALWRAPDELAGALADFLRGFVAADTWLVTMTGELCDCFSSKAAGVDHILDAVSLAAARVQSEPGAVLVWHTGGGWLPLDEARQHPDRVAAANWLAVAAFAARLSPVGSCVLLDIGSTTTDVIPIHGGRPVPGGRTDPERLALEELVYTGVRRTPVASLVATLPFRGKACSVAAETFATTLDAYLLTGDIPECQDDTATADGRAATVKCARQRLARMICADAAQLAPGDSRAGALQIAAAQEQRIAEAAGRVAGRLDEAPSLMITAGSGEFLAQRVAARLDLPALSLGDEIGPEGSTCACAYAMCTLFGSGMQTRERT